MRLKVLTPRGLLVEPFHFPFNRPTCTHSASDHRLAKREHGLS